MPSPLPGMDPYLEGYLWPDFHHRLATEISRRLTPRLRPRYVARIEISVVEDTSPEVEIGIMYPDVEVVTSRLREAEPVPYLGGASATVAITPARVTVAAPDPIQVRVPTVEIRDVTRNELVTSIEILSPVNKREPGLTPYLEKRDRLRRAGVHVVEIDLLRRGRRPSAHPRLPAAAYRMTLFRAGKGTLDAWPVGLRDPLPVLPVPLRDPDADVPLELGLAVAALYDEAAYDLSVDYTQPPPAPALSDADSAWLDELLHGVGVRR